MYPETLLLVLKKCVMNKVYLLMRNNTIWGPFSIDELLQQHLTSTDLIWIEGRSVAWCSPSQIRELNNDFEKILSSIDKETKTQDAPVQAVRLPELSFEERVEAIRNKALAHKYDAELKRKQVVEEEKFSSPYYGSEKEPVNMVYHSSRKYVTLPQLIAAGALTTFAAWVWYSGWSPVNPKAATQQAAVAPVNMVSIGENAAKLKVAVDTSRNLAVTTDSAQVASVAAFTLKKQTVVADTGITSANKAAVTDPVVATTQTETTTTPVEEPAKKDVVNDATAKPEEKKEIKTEEVKDASTEETEKKKSFGQVIKGIFKKKKKDKSDNGTED
jgi:hypothetical protein